MDYLYRSLFRMPTTMTLAGRISTITNGFVNAIIPTVEPSNDEVKQALDILDMTPETFRCAYCGDTATEWDHFRPLVKDKMPTGFISEIYNLVPSCGKCNQSKGNKEWTAWILSNAKLSPKSRGIQDLAAKIKRLEAYERWGSPHKLDFEDNAGQDAWAQHWDNCERVCALLRESQRLASEINSKIRHEFEAT